MIKIATGPKDRALSLGDGEYCRRDVSGRFQVVLRILGCEGEKLTFQVAASRLCKTPTTGGESRQMVELGKARCGRIAARTRGSIRIKAVGGTFSKILGI